MIIQLVSYACYILPMIAIGNNPVYFNGIHQGGFQKSSLNTFSQIEGIHFTKYLLTLTLKPSKSHSEPNQNDFS
jgi:hypothetical protein